MKGYNGRARDAHFDRELNEYLDTFDDDECEYDEDDDVDENERDG